MAHPTSPGPVRRAVRAARAAHHRNSERWIERIEDPSQRRRLDG